MKNIADKKMFRDIKQPYNLNNSNIVMGSNV